MRAKAGEVLANLLQFWEEMGRIHGQKLEVPKWEILKDLLEIVPYIHWPRHLASIEAKKLKNFEKDKMGKLYTRNVLVSIMNLY